MTHSPKVFVLDTSVLLSEGSKALRNYGENEVVIPLVVIEELESKRHEPILGRFARDVLRTLEELNVKSNGSINDGVAINSKGGIVRTEINHIKDATWLPDAYRHDTRNDTRIITVAGNLIRQDGRDVTIVSKDFSLRLKATVILDSLKTSDYISQDTISGGFKGSKDVVVTSNKVQELHDKKVIASPDVSDEDPANMAVLLYPNGSSNTTLALQAKSSKTDKNATLTKVRQDKTVFDVKPRTMGQKIAIEYLTNKNIEIVSLGGKAGTGKTMLAVAAGLDQVMETHDYKKISVFRPLYAVGGQDLGYLPGTEEEKMSPWADAIFDSIESQGSNIIDEIKARNILEVLPVTHLRGRTLNRSYIIVDEAQNLDTPTLLTILSRVGEQSKIVFCWDGAQKDNDLIGRNDGIVSLVEMLRDEPLFAHISLMQSQRSKVAEIASNILETYLH